MSAWWLLVGFFALCTAKCKRPSSDGHLVMTGIENGYVLVTVGDMVDRDLTICFWSSITYNGDPMPIATSGHAGEPESWAIQVRAGGMEKGALEFEMTNTPELLARGLFDKDEQDPGWHHYCASFKFGLEKALYRDGVLLGKVSLTPSPLLEHVHETKAQRVFIGAQQGSNLLLSGSIDEFLIYGKTLSDSDVSLVFQNTDRAAISSLANSLLLHLPFREQTTKGAPNFRTSDLSKGNSVALLRGRGASLAIEGAHYYDCPESRHDLNFDFLGIKIPSPSQMQKGASFEDFEKMPPTKKRKQKDEL